MNRKQTKAQWAALLEWVMTVGAEVQEVPAPATPGDIPLWVSRLTLAELRSADRVVEALLAHGAWPEMEGTTRAQLHLRVDLACEFVCSCEDAGSPWVYRDQRQARLNVLTELWWYTALEWSQRQWGQAPLKGPSETGLN
jgi:hypothetical protein